MSVHQRYFTQKLFKDKVNNCLLSFQMKVATSISIEENRESTDLRKVQNTSNHFHKHAE